MTLSRTSEVEDLARVAYDSYQQAMRAALPARQAIEMPHFVELSPTLQEIWRHVAITVWNEIWTNFSPPVVATPPGAREASRRKA